MMLDIELLGNVTKDGKEWAVTGLVSACKAVVTKSKPLLKLWLALETAQLSARLIPIGQLRHSIC